MVGICGASCTAVGPLPDFCSHAREGEFMHANIIQLFLLENLYMKNFYAQKS